MNLLKRSDWQIIGPFKAIGDSVYNVAADASRLNAFVPISIERSPEMAKHMASALTGWWERCK